MLWHIKIKMLGDWTGLSHPGIAFTRRAMPTIKGAVQEDDYRTEVRFLKIKIYLRIKIFPPQVHRASGSANCKSLDPAWTALPLIRTGTHHTLGPVRISCLGQKDGKEKWPIYYDRKKEKATPKNTSKPKKIGPDCFCFCFTPFFLMVKGIKTKRKIKEKENRSPDPGHYWPDMDSGPGSGPLWPGF